MLVSSKTPGQAKARVFSSAHFAGSGLGLRGACGAFGQATVAEESKAVGAWVFERGQVQHRNPAVIATFEGEVGESAFLGCFSDTV